MEHKTIICKPEEFDKEFENWVNSLDDSNGAYISNVKIQHHENYHYILYKMKYHYSGED
jgi:hypothetical protein